MALKSRTFLVFFAAVASFAIQAEIDVQMPTPPEMLSAEDISGSKNAADMAIFGAIMAQSQCAQLMAKSMDDDLSEDEKQMYQMMAQQQCAQAQASQKAGEENKRNLDKLKDPAPMPELGKAQAFEAPKAPSDTEDQSVLQAFGEIEDPGSPRQFAPLASAAAEEEPKPTVPQAEELPEEEGIITPPPPAKSTLPSIPKSRLTVDESDKGAPAVAPNFAGVGPVGFAKPGTSADESALDIGNEASAEEQGVDYGRSSRKYAVSNSSRGASGGAGGGGSAPFNSQGIDLAATMNDGVRRNNLEVRNNGGVIQVRSKNKKRQSILNVFEFANWKYQKLAYDELRIMTRKQKAVMKRIGRSLKKKKNKKAAQARRSK